MSIEALKKSINHWEKNVRAEHPEQASTDAVDCALCDEYNSRGEPENLCRGCPVHEKTGEQFCKSTPYTAAHHAYNRWEVEPTEVNRQLWREAAEKELRFLARLLLEMEKRNGID